VTTAIEEAILAGSVDLRVVDLRAKPLTLADIEAELADIQNARGTQLPPCGRCRRGSGSG